MADAQRITYVSGKYLEWEKLVNLASTKQFLLANYFL